MTSLVIEPVAERTVPLDLNKASCVAEDRCTDAKNNKGEGYFRTIRGQPHFFLGEPGSGVLSGGFLHHLFEGKSKSGSKTSVFYAGPNGQPVALEGEYRIIEASSMVPSHNPVSFGQNESYPQGLQERAYHRDKSEQAKVRTNAKNMHPALILNTNPDALNGPPILNEEGHVLGGNSRAMSLQLVHQEHPEKAKELVSYLKSHAYQFGLSAGDVEGFKNPVVVRVVNTKDQDENLLVRAMNEGFTQSMDPRTYQVAMSRRLDGSIMDRLADEMEPDQTLRDYFNSNKGKSFVHELSRVGVIDDRNRNQYLNKDGKLNEDGKTFVERILVGKVVGDADLLSNTQPSLVSSLARSVPYMIQAEGYGKGYNIRKKVKDALSAFNKMNDLNIAPPRNLKGEQLDQSIKMVKNNMDDMFEGVHPVNKDKATGLLFETFVRKGGPNQLASVFRDFVVNAKSNPEGQISLLGPVNPDDVLVSSLSHSLKKSIGLIRVDAFLRVLEEARRSFA